ncbi:Rieske (2Fe-2S) protein [Ekhidna sp.]|uniref:Rieske (2Fe-2S) protein n=1 Tax=Ekhidna sp. TaxID=2608089 RepID=UPI003BAB6E16
MRVKLFESEDKAKEILEDNHPRLIRTQSKEICIVRHGSNFFAFQNACPHMGENLHKGKTNYLNEIVCPLHTYRFSMRTGEEAEQRCKALRTYRVIIDKEGVFLEV